MFLSLWVCILLVERFSLTPLQICLCLFKILSFFIVIYIPFFLPYKYYVKISFGYYMASFFLVLGEQILVCVVSVSTFSQWFISSSGLECPAINSSWAGLGLGVQAVYLGCRILTTFASAQTGRVSPLDQLSVSVIAAEQTHGLDPTAPPMGDFLSSQASS